MEEMKGVEILQPHNTDYPGEIMRKEFLVPCKLT